MIDKTPRRVSEISASAIVIHHDDDLPNYNNHIELTSLPQPSGDPVSINSEEADQGMISSPNDIDVVRSRSGYQPQNNEGFRYTALRHHFSSSSHSSLSPSLSEAYATIPFDSSSRSKMKKCLTFAGLGLMVSVGYMDPGNWATDIAGGSQFGYDLLFVILLSNLWAMLLQYLSLKLGVVTGRDLAQACRDAYRPWICYTLWILAEIAIAATDLAEVIGSAIALQLLFNIPIVWGCVITVADVFIVMLLEGRSIRYLEVVIALLTVAIGVCFVYEMAVSNADWGQVGIGLLPSASILTNSEKLYIAIGVLGATVMPHNLYLHSAIIQTRSIPSTPAAQSSAIYYGAIDSSLSLFFAFFINAAILILSAAAFHGKIGNDGSDLSEVADISEAHQLLSLTVGNRAASTLFAVALLAAGQQSTMTGTLCGQIVMEGFISIKLKPTVRRLITRIVAIVPALLVTTIAGEKSVGRLLVSSQVILSIQLSFAVVPLVLFTSDPAKMGLHVNRLITKIFAWAVALIIMGLNCYLVISLFIKAVSA